MLLVDHLDYQKLMAKQMVIHVTSTPGTPVEGQVYSDSTDKILYYHNATAFRKLAMGPVAAVTNEHIAVFDGTGGAQLKSGGITVSSIPTLPIAITDIGSWAAGAIISGGVGDWTTITAGTLNYVLKMGATYPAWGQVDYSELSGSQPAPISHAYNTHSGTVPLADLADWADGRIIIGNGTSWVYLVPGNSSDVLTMDADRPTWVAAGAPGAHTLLGASHSDTTTDTVVAGRLIYGNATPAWDMTVDLTWVEASNLLTLNKTSADGTSAIIKTTKERTTTKTAVAGDLFTQIEGWFWNNNATPVLEKWGQIDFTVVDAVDGSEDSEMNFSIAKAGTLTEVATLDASGLTLEDNLIVGGDLTVNGTTTTVNTATLAIEDPIIELANGNAADTVDIGIYWTYNDGTQKYGGIFRDAGDGNRPIVFYEESTTDPGTGTIITWATYADVAFGSVRAGTWLGDDVGVAYGGTGASSFTAYSLIAGGTTTTGALQSVGVGASQYRTLLSGTASALPTWSPYTIPSTVTVGSIFHATATTAVGALASVSAGSYLRSGGVTTASVWSTLKLPNTLAINQMVYASTANNLVALSVSTTTGTFLRNTTTAGIPAWSTLVLPNAVTTAGMILRASGANTFAASAITIVNTFAQYSIPIASTADNLTALATVNSAVLVTSAAGVPSWQTGQGANHVTKMISALVKTAGGSAWRWNHALDISVDTDIVVQVWGVGSNTDIQVYPGVAVFDKDNIDFTFGANYADDQFKAVLIY